MGNKSRTEITIETHRTFIVRRRPHFIQAWCADCAAATSFASPEDAAPLAGSSAREIYRAIEAGRLHFIEADDRRLRVCVASLLPAGEEAQGWPADAAGGDLSPVEAEPAALAELMSETQVETIHPDGSSTRKKAWRLTREAFDMLLGALAADRDTAASRYEAIRARLLKFFECRGCPIPEDLADDTINRVARRLYEGRQIWTSEPASYFYGVARNVLREYWASPERGFERLDALPPLAHPQTDGRRHLEAESERLYAERRLDWLIACLDQLPAESRELILDYYRGDRGERIRHRQQLAERLGIPPNALRIRAHRIRERLERQFSERLRQSPAL